MTEPNKDPFVDAFEAVLQPLASAMVARGITLAQAYEALKVALVQAAEEKHGEAAPDSAISLSTGLHRKDVKRLRARDVTPPKRSGMNAMAQAVGYWTASPEYRNADGTPRALVRGGEGGFDELVRLAKIDLPPATVLAALSDLGVIEQDAEGAIHLIKTEVVPKTGSADAIEAYRATVTTHLRAATHNLSATEGRFFDRMLRYSHLSDASIAQLDAAARAQAEILLKTLNDMAHDLQRQDEASGANGRFAFGAYEFTVASKEKDQ